MNHKDIRQYIHNTLGIPKIQIYDLILEELKAIVKEEVTKALHDEQYIEHLVEKEIIRQLKLNEPRSSYIVNTTNSLYNKIDEVIHDEVMKRLVIELKSTTD